MRERVEPHKPFYGWGGGLARQYNDNVRLSIHTKSAVTVFDTLRRKHIRNSYHTLITHIHLLSRTLIYSSELLFAPM